MRENSVTALSLTSFARDLDTIPQQMLEHAIDASMRVLCLFHIHSPVTL